MRQAPRPACICLLRNGREQFHLPGSKGGAQFWTLCGKQIGGITTYPSIEVAYGAICADCLARWEHLFAQAMQGGGG